MEVSIKIDLIRYQGTKNFITALLQDTESKEYYFGFSKTYPPKINIENDDDYLYGKFNQKLLTLNRKTMSFTTEAEVFGKDTLFNLIKIKPFEFDSMYKLLECVWNDE